MHLCVLQSKYINTVYTVQQSKCPNWVYSRGIFQLSVKKVYNASKSIELQSKCINYNIFFLYIYFNLPGVTDKVITAVSEKDKK